MLGSLGWQELLIIMVILMLLFGASRVSGIFGALGKGVREFRSEVKSDEKKDGAAPSAPAAASDDKSPTAKG